MMAQNTLSPEVLEFYGPEKNFAKNTELPFLERRPFSTAKYNGAIENGRNLQKYKNISFLGLTFETENSCISCEHECLLLKLWIHQKIARKKSLHEIL